MDFVSTNIVKQGTKEPVFAPYSLFEVKGTSGKPVRVGVFGIIRYSPVWQKAGPSGENLAVASPVEMIKTYLPEVRKKSDVVVLLASISKDDAHDLAKELPDLDLVVGAYGGIYSTVEENEGRVRIIYVGNQGKRIGESRVAVDASRRVADIVSYLHFLTARYPEDKAMAGVVAAVNARIAKPAEGPGPAEPAKPDAVVPAGGH
jgi:2',3'-cyclic-nucleotide 2'-phosphodiesterase (5'-nucleotidase family)